MQGTRWTAPMLGIAASLLACGPAAAQYAPVDPMPRGEAATSVMANAISGRITDGEGGSDTISPRCFADSGPGPERRTMEAEYRRRMASGGQAGADAWRAEHGRAYRARLVADGKCPASVISGQRP